MERSGMFREEGADPSTGGRHGRGAELLSEVMRSPAPRWNDILCGIPTPDWTLWSFQQIVPPLFGEIPRDFADVGADGFSSVAR